MSGLRGFGFVIERGRARHWYVDKAGVKRWTADASPVDPVLPEIAQPDPLSADEDLCRCSLRTKLVGDGCQHCNPELHADLSADEAEHETNEGLLARADWELESELKGAHDDDRR